VRLRGHAPSRAARAALAAKAKALFTNVVDESSVAPGAPGGGDWQIVMAGALDQLARLETGAVRASGLKLTVVGETSPEAAQAVQAFYRQGAPGGFTALVDLSAPGQAMEIPGVAGLKLVNNAPAADCQQAFAGLLARNVINFDTGSAVIAPSSRTLLDDLARVARRCDQYSIEIAGHTDDRGDRAVNMKLSRARAESVVGYLVDQGVAPERLEAAGFGPDRPRAPNRTSAGQAQNRRIEFTVKS
jgi:OOP family OmpA-OmpF porin